MLIGIDFDNTIVCYDELFHKVARERNLIPADLPVNKSEVRNYLRRAGQEDIWTEMQGAVYGGRMAEAMPYPGVIEFFKTCRAAGIEVRIISHKTRYPFLGEKFDLHAAAYHWLELQGFFDPNKIGLRPENAFFELTKAEKLQRVAACGCTHFIDDLPEILNEPAFPVGAEKILFDPANIYPKETLVRYQSWGQIKEFFSLQDESSSLRKKISPFLSRNGISGEFRVELLRGGGNNRVYRIRDGARSLTLKEYFQNPADPRDRFNAEKSFYNFISDCGVQGTAERLGWDLENRVGLFSFIDGRKLDATEIGERYVQQAATFIVRLNQHRAVAAAKEIRSASEACFSIAEHVACVDRRIARLQSIECTTPVDQQAATFTKDELSVAWNAVRNRIVETAGVDLNTPLPESERCLSPSDFGFHNALLLPEGDLRFFDFEYAGWDDPAKLVCDFFSQPQIPVGLQLWNAFVGTLTTSLSSSANWMKRAELLLPAYQIKWCCIILNEFLRSDQARRDFAMGGSDSLARKALQLDKAKAALGRLNKTV